MNKDHEVNRASWDEMAAAHGQDAYYDSEALVAGGSSLIEEEEAALLAALGAGLVGRRVLHVQCHLGFDAITLARRGAHVTGVDFSSVALSKARLLAERCGVEVEWVCADVTELPEVLNGRFDLAWATIGILCWISDLRGWMRSVGGTLASDGRLVLIDGHPRNGVDGRGAVPERSRETYEMGWDYATPLRTGPQVQFTHSLEEVSAAASAAGLHVIHLQEHVDLSDDLRIAEVVRESDGRYRRRVAGQPQPLLFTLIGKRSEAGLDQRGGGRPEMIDSA